jgi:hypothetical protein
MENPLYELRIDLAAKTARRYQRAFFLASWIAAISVAWNVLLLVLLVVKW